MLDLVIFPEREQLIVTLAFSNSPESQSHASLEPASRRIKALKIGRLHNPNQLLLPVRVLKIASGSGGISHYCATHQDLNCEGVSVDFNDNWQVQVVKALEFCFASQYFDVVVPNHVIKHVVGAEAHHLKEVNYAFKPSGIGCLAETNRRLLPDPHYRLIFENWRPLRWHNQ